VRGRQRRSYGWGSLWQDNGLDFSITTGTTTSGTNLLGRYFKPLLKQAELPAIRLHDLRHTCATILLMAGKHPKFVQEMFGHANISMPLDAYSHVIEGHGQWARRRYGRGPLMVYCCRIAATGDRGFPRMRRNLHR
jgi:integrase